jgi:hypothetical protein
MSVPSISGAVKVVEGFLVHVVERKVKAAATAATAASLVVSLLGLYVFHGTVPDWVTAVVGTAVTGALTFAAGWLAKHTPRTVAPVDPPVVTEPAPAPGSSSTPPVPGSGA